MVYRNTKQRKDVYDVLKGLNKHLTADQVMDALIEKDKKVGLATVYRNLNHLYENNMIGKVIDQGIVLYDGNPSPHDHLHCRICNKYFDMPSQIKREDIISLEQETGFDIESYFITYEGVCNNCKEN